jgi:hypothetical protein
VIFAGLKGGYMMKDIIFVGEACEFVIGFLIKLTNHYNVCTNLNSEVKGVSLAFVNDICARIKKAKDDDAKGGIFNGRASLDLNVIKSIIDSLGETPLPLGAILVNKILFKGGVIMFNVEGEQEQKQEQPIMKHLIFVNGGVDGVEPIELSEESIQGAIEHYQSLLETVRHYNKQHAQEEAGKALKEKELMEKAMKFEAGSQNSFSFGECEETLKEYKKDWSFLKYVDIRKALVNSLHYQASEVIIELLKLKEFKEILMTGGVFILKSAIENVIANLGNGSGYIKDFCVLVTMHELKKSLRCDAMLDFYRDLEQEKRDMYKYENFRNMMFILRTEVYGLNDGDFYTPYKNALIKEILGEIND